MEIWKNLNEHYQVSSEGRVKSLRKNIILKPSIRSDGYKFLNVSGYLHRRTWKVHQLVAKTFLPNPENKPCVNHKNGIKTDNRVENLEWCTYQENTIHAFRVLKRNPTRHFGEKNKSSKKVKCLKTGLVYCSIRAAAASVGLNGCTLSAMLNGRNPNYTTFNFA